MRLVTLEPQLPVRLPFLSAPPFGLIVQREAGFIADCNWDLAVVEMRAAPSFLRLLVWHAASHLAVGCMSFFKLVIWATRRTYPSKDFACPGLQHGLQR